MKKAREGGIREELLRAARSLPGVLSDDAQIGAVVGLPPEEIHALRLETQTN